MNKWLNSVLFIIVQVLVVVYLFLENSGDFFSKAFLYFTPPTLQAVNNIVPLFQFIIFFDWGIPAPIPRVQAWYLFPMGRFKVIFLQLTAFSFPFSFHFWGYFYLLIELNFHILSCPCFLQIFVIIIWSTNHFVSDFSDFRWS